jgi:hypothetical protein
MKIVALALIVLALGIIAFRLSVSNCTFTQAAMIALTGEAN